MWPPLWGGSPELVQIVDLVDGVLDAELLFHGPTRVASRPSDAVTLTRTTSARCTSPTPSSTTVVSSPPPSSTTRTGRTFSGSPQRRRRACSCDRAPVPDPFVPAGDLARGLTGPPLPRPVSAAPGTGAERSAPWPGRTARSPTHPSTADHGLNCDPEHALESVSRVRLRCPTLSAITRTAGTPAALSRTSSVHHDPVLAVSGPTPSTRRPGVFEAHHRRSHPLSPRQLG